MDWRGKRLYFQTLVQKTKLKSILEGDFKHNRGGSWRCGCLSCRNNRRCVCSCARESGALPPLVPWVQLSTEDNEKRQISSEHKKWLFIDQVFQMNREGVGVQVKAGQNISEQPFPTEIQCEPSNMYSFWSSSGHILKHKNHWYVDCITILFHAVSLKYYNFNIKSVWNH